jgi:AcrR family transcriptional regulator
MARPLSEEKRQALLASAADLIATLGTGASTAKIAQAANVAEGTLFTYFSTKDELLNQLYVEIETDLAGVMTAPYPEDAGPRERIRHVWNRLIGWGLANPVWRKAIRQLEVSDRVAIESQRRCNAMFHDARAMVEQSLSGHADPERIAFYIDTVLFGLAEIAIEAIEASPENHEHFSQTGFDLFWKGTTA